MKLKLHHLIFIAMGLGFALGYWLYTLRHAAEQASTPEPGTYVYTMWWLNLLGPTVFMASLKMIIAPLIFASIVAGVTSLPNMAELGAIGWKTMAYYMVTTTIAVAIGLILVTQIQPGRKAAPERVRAERETVLAERVREYTALTAKPATGSDGRLTGEYLVWLADQETQSGTRGREGARFSKIMRARDRTPGDLFVQDIMLPLLMNPFASLSASPPNSLGLIFFALVLGIACAVVGEPARHVVAFFHGLNEVIMQITHWIMAVSPFAIGCIVAWLVAKLGPEVFNTVAWYCGVVIGGIAIHICALLTIAWTIGGKSPLAMWKGIREAWLIAFTTRSSAATLPVTIACTTEKLGVSPKVARFALPLGATMNMDGTALYEGVAVIFLIQIYGGLADVPIAQSPELATLFLIFITAVLASVGAAAVPDAGLVTMVLVASAVGLPIYYLPLIFGVDAFLDMFRTSTNVLGDVVGSVVVNRLESARLGDGAAAQPG